MRYLNLEQLPWQSGPIHLANAYSNKYCTSKLLNTVPGRWGGSEKLPILISSAHALVDAAGSSTSNTWKGENRVGIYTIGG